MKIPILLEDKVECVHSGFVGIAVCRSEFINGCVQFDVVPKVGKKNEPKESQGIDEQSLKVIKKGPRHPRPIRIEKEKNTHPIFRRESRTGGPNHKSKVMEGY